MEVSSGKEIRAVVLALSFVVCASAFLIYTCGSLGGAVFLMAFGGIVVIRYWIAVGRTITFSQEGIRVQMLGFVRFYPWEKVHQKSYFDCTNSFGYKSAYSYGAEFSLSSSRRPHWLMPEEYSVIFHPWSYIFVFFAPQDEIGVRLKYPRLYETEGDAFRETMMEWGLLRQCHSAHIQRN